MIDSIRDWLIGMTGTALVCSAVMALSPEGAAKKVIKLTCGFALMIALMSIVTGIDYGSLSLYMSEYRQQAEDTISDAVSESSKQTRFIIEKECEAYILDKAAQYGASLDSAAVNAKWSDEGYWYPESVELSGELNADTRRELATVIETNLGIPANKQIWSTDDET